MLRLLCFLLLLRGVELKLNVLLICTDDLRPELSVYGRDVYTPNFARLAARSVVFDLAYNQYAVCHPSRASFLTGVRPDTHNIATFEDATNIPWFDSLFTVMTRNGYHTMGVGKLFHSAKEDDKSLFDSGRWDGKWYQYQNIEQGYLNSSTTPDAYRPDNFFRDYEIASRGIEGFSRLQAKVSNGDKANWFLSIGFKQPHTWYHMPKKYFDLYKDNKIFSRLADVDRFYPNNTPSIGYRCCALERISYMNGEGRLPSTQYEIPRYAMKITSRGRKELLWGYLAGVSFLDAQLGRVLDEMDRLDLWKNTIVVFTSDHGMSLGEKGMWEKNTLFEETTRVPLIIADPRFPKHHGTHYRHPVEILNLAETIYDLTGIDHVRGFCPRSKYCHTTDGISLGPVIREGPDVKLSRDFALTQTRVCREPTKFRVPLVSERGQQRPTGFFAYGCTPNDPIAKHHSFMGYSMRTENYRYTMWIPYINRGPSGPGRPDLTKDIFDEELYYHKSILPHTKLLFDETEERENLIDSPNATIIAAKELMRSKLLKYLREDALYGLGELRDRYLSVLGRKRDATEEVSNTSYRSVWESIDTIQKARKQLRREMRQRKKYARAATLVPTSPATTDLAANFEGNSASSKSSAEQTSINNIDSSESKVVISKKNPIRIRMEFNHGT